MSAPSWMHLGEQDKASPLPADLRARDPMGARDCGWVEQMTPFIRSHSRPDSWVLDPFCGFGSTLVAAWQCGVRAVGVELSAERADLARERLRRLGASPAHHPVLTGNLANADFTKRLATQLREEPGQGEHPIGLCLTNIPYFGCNQSPGEPSDARQLYLAPHYETFLQGLREVFLGVHRLLAPDGWCIVMSQNLRLGDTFVPQAWDVARLLSDRFHLHDERILIYDKATTPSAESPSVGNRAHEYALIFRKGRPAMDVHATAALLQAMSQAGFQYEVYGSFAALQAGRSAKPAHDLDLLVPSNEAEVSRLLRWLESQGFRIESWNAPCSPPVSIEALAYRHYFRAKRLSPQGDELQVDIAVACS